MQVHRIKHLDTPQHLEVTGEQLISWCLVMVTTVLDGLDFSSFSVLLSSQDISMAMAAFWSSHTLHLRKTSTAVVILLFAQHAPTESYIAFVKMEGAL